MLTTTTKSLIFISLILTFAVALQDGDQIAFKAHGSSNNAKYQYLNARTVDGSVGMAKNTDSTTLSGTWWKAHQLSDGNWAFESLGSIHNTKHIYLNANAHTGYVNLARNTDSAKSSGTHWSLQALSDGTVALKSLGNSKNHKYQYLTANTHTGSVDLSRNTGLAKLSVAHWEIVTLAAASSPSSTTTGNQPASITETADAPNSEILAADSETPVADPEIPAANSQLATFLQAHADELKKESDVDVNYCLQQFDPTTFEAKYGAVMDAIINAGCVHGLQSCSINDLYGVLDQLKGSGATGTTIQQVSILIGSIIGSMAGAEACNGARLCQYLGGKIGAGLACLSVSKEVYEGVMTAISTLKDVANQAGDMGQDALNAITDTANSVENGVQDAIGQINQGTANDAINTLKGVTDDVGQSFTDLGNSIAGGLTDAGSAIVDAGQQAGGAIQGAAEQAGGAVQDAGGAVASGFCGIFGC